MKWGEAMGKATEFDNIHCIYLFTYLLSIYIFCIIYTPESMSPRSLNHLPFRPIDSHDQWGCLYPQHLVRKHQVPE